MQRAIEHDLLLASDLIKSRSIIPAIDGLPAGGARRWGGRRSTMRLAQRTGKSCSAGLPAHSPAGGGRPCP